MRGARVSEFFSKNPNLKTILGRGGVGVGARWAGLGGLKLVIFFFQRIQI